MYNLAMNKINNMLLAALLFLSSAAHALTLEGRVVGVADGDTITILDNTNTQHIFMRKKVKWYFMQKGYLIKEHKQQTLTSITRNTENVHK